MNKSAKFLSLLAAGLFVSTSLSAQTANPENSGTEKPARADRPNFSPVMPVKIKPRQGGADSISKAAADVEKENALDPDTFGLYTTASEGSLGGALWQNYPPADVSGDLTQLNTNIASPVFRDLLFRALLTTPDAPAVQDEAGEAFSARLETLIDLGAYEETFRLYKKLEGNIPSEKAALAGVKGAFATGRTGLACLEEKALAADLKENEGTRFWADLNAFCGILLNGQTDGDSQAGYVEAAKSYAVSKNLKAPAALTELNGKSLVEIVVLQKAGLLPSSLFSPEATKALKPQILALLLNQSPEAAETRLSLLNAAVEKGLRKKEDLESEYRLVSQSPLASGYWKSLLAIYGNTSSSADKATLLKSALGLSEKPDYTALQPFASAFGGLKDLESFTQDEAKQVLSLLIRSKSSVSGLWVDKAFDISDLKDKESVTDVELIEALKAHLKRRMADSEAQDDKSAQSSEATDIVKLHALSLILSEEEAEDKPTDKSYEKLLSLTGPNDYVMPSKEFMNNLSQASVSQDTGKIVLYSLQVLNGQRVSELHPLVLYRISEALKSVGLVEEVRSLVHEALADMIE